MRSGAVCAATDALKYGEELKRCPDQPCPNPKRFQPRTRGSFRYLHEPATDDDFKPIGHPDHDGNDGGATCGHYALSFFESLEAAKKKWETLSDRQDAELRYGTHVAAVALTTMDGLMSEPGKRGHFELHEYADAPGFVSRVEGYVRLPSPTHGPSREEGDRAR